MTNIRVRVVNIQKQMYIKYYIRNLVPVDTYTTVPQYPSSTLDTAGTGLIKLYVPEAHS